MDYEANKHLFISSDGKRVIAGLFEETVDRGTKFIPPFKLSEWRKVYIECSDPTEYLPASKLVGDWGHWQLIRNHPKIKPIMDNWAMEVEVKLRSEALIQMSKHSKKDGGTAAAKWIAEGGFTRRDLRKKVDKSVEEKVVKEINERVSKDAARLGLTVIKGSK